MKITIAMIFGSSPIFIMNRSYDFGLSLFPELVLVCLSLLLFDLPFAVACLPLPRLQFLVFISKVVFQSWNSTLSGDHISYLSPLSLTFQSGIPLLSSFRHLFPNVLIFQLPDLQNWNGSLADWNVFLGLTVSSWSYSHPFRHQVLKSIVVGLIHDRFLDYFIIVLYLRLQRFNFVVAIAIAERSWFLIPLISWQEIGGVHPRVFIQKLGESAFFEVKFKRIGLSPCWKKIRFIFKCLCEGKRSLLAVILELWGQLMLVLIAIEID